jgi:hypothetical protein
LADVKHTYWHRQIDSLARELSRFAIACDVKLLQPGIAERVLEGDDTVCGRRNPRAFEQMRKHLMALFEVEERAIKRVGAKDVREILNAVRVAVGKLRNTNPADSSGAPPEI